ncbi:gamma carbonic anhydrase family protein [Paracoccus sp. Z330]|uniref:Gamma carbonic anhydrase family protein n=1 Tax=Paracoccus onchidii TaxID=3017813 RepID=A0ABT4ZJH1_9RHOB|nr:gamma carbonic anhydrase family protein [Paracoccus onchidii]MDB6179514.1 gamma carbonic anhydrase family protein [Paracoccus onchidii]
MALYALGNTKPRTAGPNTFWIAPSAHVIGDVTLGRDVGIWFGAVLRGDQEPLRIGDESNIQEHAMIHADPGFPATIGNGVTIGHGAIVHGCTIGNGTLVGMGAIILNGARIGNNCLIGAGALVTEGKEIPDGSVVMGSPAKVVRTLTPEGIAALQKPARNYVRNWKRFAAELITLD